MIGGLQGEFGDLDIKYLKQNISKSRSKISGSFGRTLQLCMSDRVSAIRGSKHVWLGKLKRPTLPSNVRCRMWNIRSEDPDMFDQTEFRMWDIWRRWNVGWTEFRMWDIRRRWDVGRTEFFPRWNELCRASQGEPFACARCRDPSHWWHGERIVIRSNSIRIPQEDTWRAPLSGLPQGEARDTREHHTPEDSISYPDMLMAKDFKASVLHVSELSIAFPWIPNNSPQSWIVLVIKLLTKTPKLTQFD